MLGTSSPALNWVYQAYHNQHLNGVSPSAALTDEVHRSGNLLQPRPRSSLLQRKDSLPRLLYRGKSVALNTLQERVTTPSFQTMIGKIVPYCDQHHAPMRRRLPERFHGCIKDKFCERRYDPLIGYYSGNSRTKTRPKYCPTHYSPLFVCAYDSHGDSRQYACPVQGCEYVTESIGIPNISEI